MAALSLFVNRNIGDYLSRSLGFQVQTLAEKISLFLYVDIIENASSHCTPKKKVKRIFPCDSPSYTSKCNWEVDRKLFVGGNTKIRDNFISLPTAISSERDDNVNRVSLKGHEVPDVTPVVEDIIADGAIQNKGKDKSGKGKKHDIRNNDQRFKRHIHVKYDATNLIDDTAASTLITPEKMIFIDNLPIDITESEILELYSRCGVLESIRIFNQRPDLDPGPLDKAMLAARRKERFKYLAGSRRKWHRPRTPVYALLTFQDKESCDRSLDDTLRIFGMLIRKHPVRSISPSGVKSLYLEDLPNGYRSNELEYHLTEALAPDIVVGMSAGQNSASLVRSCEVKFPSFEVAYKAYGQLQQLDILPTENEQESSSQCNLQWFRSPIDAELWWSRKIGFD